MAKCTICNKNVTSGLVVDAECLEKMVEVVRCKDCMYKGRWTDFCVHFTQEDSAKNIRVKDDDFCSYGVRKEIKPLYSLTWKDKMLNKFSRSE